MRPQKLISNSRHLEGSNSVGHFEIGCLSQEKTGSEIWVYYGEYSLTEICKTSLETLYMNSMPSGLICTHNAHIANAGPNVNKYESHNHTA